MGKIIVDVPKKLEERFREEIFRRYGMKRGNIKQATKEAVELWIVAKQKKERK